MVTMVRIDGWTSSKWRDKVDIAGETEGTMDEGE